MQEEPDIMLGTKVAIVIGPRERIGVVTRIDGDYVTACLMQAEWNEESEVRVHRDSVKCLAGWI